MKLRLLIAATFTIAAAHAQWNYDAKSAQSVSGSFKDIGKKATLITKNYSGAELNPDDDNSAVQNIGFSFRFNGQAFTQFVLNTNGFIKLGAAAPSAKNIYYYSATGGGTSAINVKDSNLIYAFNRNLVSLGKGTEFSVLTDKSSAGKVCIIQFKNLVDKIGQYSAVSFQIKLYETGVIEFVYGEWQASETPGTLTVAAVGIKGDNTENSINVAKGSSVEWNNEMGIPQKPYEFLNGDYAKKGPNFGNKNNVLPEAGHTYRFTPLK